jgi:hypothetical protein
MKIFLLLEGVVIWTLFRRCLSITLAGENVSSQSKEDTNKMETKMPGFYPSFSYPFVSAVLLAKATSESLLKFQFVLMEPSSLSHKASFHS